MSPATLERENFWECPECNTLMTDTQKSFTPDHTPCKGCGRPVGIYKPATKPR